MADLVHEAFQRHVGRDNAGDGDPELIAFAYAPFETETSGPGPASRLTMVLIEARLLAAPTASAPLVAALARYKRDLASAGFASRFVTMSLYGGPTKKDGRIVLALRSLLQDIRAAHEKLEGVVLVGSFPDACIVRSALWAQAHGVDLVDPNPPFKLMLTNELLAPRSDIVLADLSGRWDAVYRQDRFTLEDLYADPDAATAPTSWHDGERLTRGQFCSDHFTVKPFSYVDAFHVDDVAWTVHERVDAAPQRLRVEVADTPPGPELSDRSAGRPTRWPRPTSSCRGSTPTTSPSTRRRPSVASTTRSSTTTGGPGP